MFSSNSHKHVHVCKMTTMHCKVTNTPLLPTDAHGGIQEGADGRRPWARHREGRLEQFGDGIRRGQEAAADCPRTDRVRHRHQQVPDRHRLRRHIRLSSRHLRAPDRPTRVRGSGREPRRPTGSRLHDHRHSGSVHRRDRRQVVRRSSRVVPA